MTLLFMAGDGSRLSGRTAVFAKHVQQEQISVSTFATFTIKLTINDRDQLVAAARRVAVAAGYSKEEAEHAVRDFDIHAALTWCLVPAPNIVPGVDIVDSVSELAS